MAAMSLSEIECSYRQAKKKSEQIKILADLNACSPEEIIQALISTGKYKRRGKFLYPTEPKKCVAEHKSTNEEENGCITLETALEVIANEIKRHRETIENSNKRLEDLQTILTEMFQ